MQKLIYLDYAAATPVDERVVKAMLPYFNDKFFNPSAPYLPAVDIRQDIIQAKTTIAHLIGAKPDQLIITAGATESINLALSMASNVIYSAVEHPAVQKVAASKSSFVIAPVDAGGVVDVAKLITLVDDKTDLISVCAASSDLGTIQPLSEIAALIKQIRIDRSLAGNLTPLLFHADASQGLDYLSINPARLGLDLLTISAAKISGPKQVGALWVRPGVRVRPIIIGGGQENGLRGGTENVPGVIGFATAVKILTSGTSKQVAAKRDKLQSLIESELDQVKILGDTKKRLPNYLVVSFLGVEAERLIYRLEKVGICLSTGAACSANRGNGSLALKSIGLSESEQNASIRMTLSNDLSFEDIKLAGQMIVNEVKLERERVGFKI